MDSDFSSRKRRSIGAIWGPLRPPAPAERVRGESKAFAEALLAYYGQREKSAAKAEEAIATEPGLYELKKLQAMSITPTVLLAEARSHDEARIDYHHAATLYHTAGEMARSDSATHGAEADAWVQVMEVDRPKSSLARDALDRALAVSAIAPWPPILKTPAPCAEVPVYHIQGPSFSVDSTAKIRALPPSRPSLRLIRRCG